MFEIVLVGYLSYRNGLRAKATGQHPILWGALTFVAYMIAMMIGIAVVIINFCKDTINLSQFSSLDPKTQAAAKEQLVQVFSTHPLHMITIETFGVGGYFFIRYLIDRKARGKDTRIQEAND